MTFGRRKMLGLLASLGVIAPSTVDMLGLDKEDGWEMMVVGDSTRLRAVPTIQILPITESPLHRFDRFVNFDTKFLFSISVPVRNSDRLHTIEILKNGELWQTKSFHPHKVAAGQTFKGTYDFQFNKSLVQDVVSLLKELDT